MAYEGGFGNRGGLQMLLKATQKISLLLPSSPHLLEEQCYPQPGQPSGYPQHPKVASLSLATYFFPSPFDPAKSWGIKGSEWGGGD
jgi:hypothetical protein